MSHGAAARSSPLTVLYSHAHKQSVLSRFDELRKKQLLCDVTFVVENVNFEAHKALLAANSQYFSLMFTSDQTNQSTFRLGGVTAKAFSAVLEFMYTAQVSVEEGATEQLLATALLMEVGDLVDELADLGRSAPAPGEAEARGSKAEASKRQRGRPKKSADAVERRGTSEEVQAGDPGERRSRQSKRKIRPPVKYRSYKVGSDAAGSEEPGRRGRKGKAPASEVRCEACSKTFRNSLFLKVHQRTHTGEKPFWCPVCGKGFTQKHTLLVHQRIHTGEKPFVCSICSKALCTKHSLQEHMNLHEEEKPFDCDKCGKTFTQKRQLKSHYRVHTGKSLPECAQCHHKFMDTAQLKKHLRTHTGEKPFTCEICGKCFTAKSTLQTHIRIHRGEKPYACSICSKSFSDPSARRRHVASHSGRKPFTCSSCSLSFTRLDNLKTHTKSHSKEPRDVLQLPYQEQEIQLLVASDVGDIDFVPGRCTDQEISIIAAEGEAAETGPPRLTLLAQPPAPVGRDLRHEDAPHRAEQMRVIALSKEAMEQLAVAEEAGVEHHGHAIHVSTQGGQPISISQTSQQISSQHIQGQTFQIQAGTVSYLYTTGLPQGSV